jgi:glucokinase
MTNGPSLDRIAFPVVIGDIGGTYARFALIADANAQMEKLPIVETANHPTIEEGIENAVLTRTKLEPRSMILDLAGPISGERVPLTNCDWVVEPRKMIGRFGLKDVILLNDFEALSLSLPDLRPEDLDLLSGGEARPDGTRVVVGPGTGLGAGALVHAHEWWIPVPGEGGHIDLGPVTARDFAIWPHIERARGRISGETILSGSGLVRLYQAVCAADEVTPTFKAPADVAAAGLAGSDPQAAETLTLFATYLGRFAGDLALTFMAHGGVYLAGGIPVRIAPALKSGAFVAAFLDKAPHRALLEKMPTAIITRNDAALSGIAAFARNPGRFAVDLAGRYWRA